MGINIEAGMRKQRFFRGRVGVEGKEDGVKMESSLEKYSLCSGISVFFF